MQQEDFYQYNNQLVGEYKIAYDQMSIYIEANSAPGSEVGIILNELIDLLLSAQHDGRDIDSIIGTNRQLFCDQLIKSNANSYIDKLFNFLKAYRIIALLAFIFELLGVGVDYSGGIVNPWNVTISMGGFFGAVLLSMIIFSVFQMFIKYAVFHYKWYTKRVDTILTSIVLVILFSTILFFPNQIHELMPIPRWLFLPSMLLVYIVCTIRKRKQRQIEMQEGTYVSFIDTALLSAQDDTIDRLRKQYNKYCLKCQKKNKEPLDVKQWYEQKYRKDLKGDQYGKIGFILLLIVFILGGFLTSTLIDGIVFAMILLVIEIPMYRFINKSKSINTTLYQKIHEKNTTIFDDSLKNNMDI